MITIITTTIGGRELYLKKSVQSVLDSVGKEAIQHFVIFNGTKHIDLPLHELEHYTQHCLELNPRISIGEVLNITKESIQGDLVMKMDDDCLIHSKNFFDHIRAINQLEPRICFSPYPVGLIGNPGGVLSNDRRVIYSQQTDTYYTLRKVPHLGGFARICPALYAKKIRFSGNAHDEDVQFSSQFREFGMYYLENSIVVEHQESTLGQHERYGNIYFEGRF